ncbi:MAG: heterodisulfide reductase-related iron-sulfur binding cluster [Bacillota bacterium]|nr:heterodisulfide reductase-related iron-sulfur binding cluster [Bacillota bacterium]
MPQLADKTFEKIYSGTIKATETPRARVAYFVGCGTNFMFPDTGISTVKVLIHNNIEVIIPDGQVCCGIPCIAEGDVKSAAEMVRKNVQIFSELDVDAVITDCTSCGMMMKEKFPKLLEDDDPLQAKAIAMAQKVWEVTDYLNHIGLTAEASEMDESFTYHVPCHRGWSPTVKDAPRLLLAPINGLELREMENPEKCCGGAGTFFLDHRDLSESIRTHKIQEINETQTNLVVTQCPICRFYIASGLDKKKEVIHPITLLARAYGM